MGPEGGWTDREREQIAARAGWRPVSLGPRSCARRRAAIAALAIVNAAWERQLHMTQGTELFDFMASHKLGVLGYLSPQGTPRSALVGIAVTPELEIVFDTVSSSRKYGDLRANPAASFVIGLGGRSDGSTRRTGIPAHGRGARALSSGLFRAHGRMVPIA